MKEQEKTLEQCLAEAENNVMIAEDEVENAEDDLRKAKRVLRRAEARRDDLQKQIDAPIREAEEREAADFLAAQTGPQRPVGERPVRYSCALSEIPEWLGETWGVSLRCLIGARKYVTNAHVMIDVDSVEGLEVLPHDPAQLVDVRSEPVVRRDTPIEVAGIMCRDFGAACVSLKYAALVEDLFPGVEWRSTGDSLSALHAVVDGHVVAVVMPVRRSATEAA